MKNKFYLIMLLCFAALLAASQNINLAETVQTTDLLRSDDYSTEMVFKISELINNEVKTKEGVFNLLSITNYALTNRYGEAALPMQRKIIQVPFGAEVNWQIISQDTEVISLAERGINNLIIP
ncbi:MAG: C25 family peptidase propeptide domain-containing protein, partial [Candidatus Cloacimonetes bacterium]|nr:C25 family peptidase propeptide domain-containing protein [Candidatus Cloacimonadota bacterium]